jgi:hypothetical protein
MTNTLSPELKKQIEQEAKDLYHGPKMRTWPGRGGNHLMQMYVEGATQYALKLEQAEQLIEQMAKALEAIAYPIRYLQEQAKKEGSQINGQNAFEIADDPNWLRSKATEAIADYQTYKNGKDGKEQKASGGV